MRLVTSRTEPSARRNLDEHPGADLPERGKRDRARVVLLGDMPQPNLPVMSTEQASAEPAAAAWPAIAELLQRAARLAAEAGVESEAFMHAAWTGYLEASPGLREVLEHKQLVAQLDGLRARGRLAQA